MIDNKYKLGCIIRDAVITGSDEKTELRTIFEKRLFQTIGITVWHSYLIQDMSYPYIMISADINKNTELFSASEWTNIHDILYPKLGMRKAIVDCFNASVIEFGLPALTFPVDESVDIISVTDYKCISANIYFNVNIAKIDRAARQTFRNTEFSVRFHMSYGTEHYYLIYDNIAGMEKANDDGITFKASPHNAASNHP